MNLFVYLIVCSLTGLHLIGIAKGVDQYWRENESARGWANLFWQVDFEDDANETNLVNEAQAYNYTNVNGYNVSEVKSRYGQLRNKTGIPIDLFFQWWSVVRPFGNEMATKPKFPWMVSVQSRRRQMNSHLCSGVILTKLYILSTCRCLSIVTGSAIVPLTPKDPSYISIVAGISMLDIPLKEQLLYGQIRNAAGISIHPHCTLSHKFDYAVIELEYYLYFTNRVLPIPNLFDTFHGEKSSEGHGRSPLMKENEICQAAGWPTERIFGADDSKGKQKVNNFMILGQDVCFGTTLQVGHPFVCTKAVSGDRWISGQSGDIGSGLVCNNNRVTAILSHHSGGRAVFASLRPVLSFIWQYYQDQNEIYAMSSCQLPVISLTLIIFSTYTPSIVICL